MGEQQAQDRWAAWLATRRHGGNTEQLQRTLEFLAPIRDQVLAHAALAPGHTVLDVGCGDGLIAFAAADRVGPAGPVIFSDISVDLLDRCQELVAEAGIENHCRFVQAAAHDLAAIEDASVDAVTLRSVLIYEHDKASAFAEFHRVLRPGGHLSLFEPINSFECPEPPDRFRGHDVAPVSDLAAKVKAIYTAIQPPATDPMLNFDERDLLHHAEQAGFDEIHLRLLVDVEPSEPTSWEVAMRSAGNPRSPTLTEAIQQALNPAEADKLTNHLRPQVERGSGQQRRASAYLWALRPST